MSSSSASGSSSSASGASSSALSVEEADRAGGGAAAQLSQQQHPSLALRSWLRSSPTVSGADEAALLSLSGASSGGGGGVGGGAGAGADLRVTRLISVRPVDSVGARGSGGGGVLGSWLGLGWRSSSSSGGDASDAAAAVTVGVLSPAVVENGYTAFVSRLHESLRLAQAGAPLAVHFSWSGRSKESRLHRMREATWWVRCVICWHGCLHGGCGLWVA